MFYQLPGKSANRGMSVTFKIVEILKDYRKSVPIDFLASILDRSQAEILGEVENLEKRGVVQREGDQVKLLEVE